MDNYTSIGKLSQPPLVYTGAFLFISLQNVEEYIKNFQDKIRDEYPSLSRYDLTIQKINPANGHRVDQIVSHFVMNDPELQWGIVITNERFILQTIDYSHFRDFGEKFKRALSTFIDVTKLKYHSGLAFRQIDNIVPFKEESSLKDCIFDQFLSPQIKKINQIDHNFSRQEHTYNLENNISLIIRAYAFEKRPGPLIPDDLFPLRFSLNPDILEKRPEKLPYLLGDFEVFQPLNGKNELLSIDNIVKKLDQFHQYTSLAFREVIRPQALDRRK